MKIDGIEVSGYKYSNALSQFAVEHVDRMAEHYAHAIEKHPYFCDWTTVHPRSYLLGKIRATLAEKIQLAGVNPYDILECELAEAQDAQNHGDKTHAVEELYDCVAVLLRTIDVLEGRQKLGKPKTNS